MLNASPRPPVAPVSDAQGNTMPIWTNWFNSIFRLLGLAPTVYTGILAPSIIPNKIGDVFVNTAAGKVYISSGNTSTADWKILN